MAFPKADFTEETAKWLFSKGVVEEAALEPAVEGRISLKPYATELLRNGKAMRTLLVSLLDDQGLLCPVSEEAMRPGDDVVSRLWNWNLLLPPMRRTFAVDLSADEKALLVGGDSEALERVVELLHSRAGKVAAPVFAASAPEASYGASRRLQRSKTSKKWAKQFDSDSLSAVVVTIAQAAGIYACVMASLLSVFVPQVCPDPEPHVCTTHENFFDLVPYNKFVLAVNFITLGCFIIIQSFFGYREYWCIDAFDVDPHLPSDNLKEELELYPPFKEKLRQMNIASLVLAISLTLLVTFNFIISCVLVLGYYSAGKSSVTGLISSALLVAPRCIKWCSLAHGSHARGMPVSLFSAVPMLPNTVDKDWKFKGDVYQTGGGDAAPSSA